MYHRISIPLFNMAQEKEVEHRHSIQEKVIVEGYSGKKGDPEHLEVAGHTVEIPDYSPAETKRILWKVDCRLVPMLAFFYLLAFLDRGNIGNAKVAGMQTDLGLSGSQYNVALTVFFIPYSLLEVPCNVVAKILKPHVWLAIMMFFWGITM